MNYSDFYQIAGVKQHAEFEEYLKKIMFDPVERSAFYGRLLDINHHLDVDVFKPYFELYSAERKTNQQDYTPDSVAHLLAVITRSSAEVHENSKYAGYDATAGTGSLIIQKWHDDLIQESPWSYAPHRYTYRADELADNAIPYLIHNLAIRGMNAIVVHGDVLTGEAKQVYFIQNSKDDFMAYSDVNVMPHSEVCMEEFGITKWTADPIEHIESQKVEWQYALPMKRKALQTNTDPKIKPRTNRKNLLTLSDVAEIERARKNEIYPEGTIIIQLSATKGQVGLLKSSGKIGTQYAVIKMVDFIDSNFAFFQLKQSVKRHFHRVQEGLNVAIEEIGNIPFSFPLTQLVLKEPEYEQLTLDI